MSFRLFFPSLMFLLYLVKMTAYAHEVPFLAVITKVRQLLSLMETKTELKEADLCIYITSGDSNVTPNIKTEVLFTNWLLLLQTFTSSFSWYKLFKVSLFLSQTAWCSRIKIISVNRTQRDLLDSVWSKLLCLESTLEQACIICR